MPFERIDPPLFTLLVNHDTRYFEGVSVFTQRGFFGGACKFKVNLKRGLNQ